MKNAKTFICISNYFKGADFLIHLKSLGNTVYLITSEKLRDKPWPHDFIWRARISIGIWSIYYSELVI